MARPLLGLRSPGRASPSRARSTAGTTTSKTSERVKSPRTIAAYRYGASKLVHSVGNERPLDSITTEDIEGLLAALKRSGKSDGGRALVYRPIRTLMLATTGARLSEVAELKVGAIDLAGQRFAVLGKRR